MLQDAIPAMQLQRRQQQSQRHPFALADQVNADRDAIEFIVSWMIVAALVTFIAVLVVG
jgi:hypothetical protein